MKEVAVIAMGRSAIGRAPHGSLRLSRPEDIAAQVLEGVLASVPELDPKEIEDIIVGCAFPEAEQGTNVARIIGLGAGLPNSIPGQTVNRFCSSGLQAIAAGANAIMAGEAEVIAAGGVEFMGSVPLGGNAIYPNPQMMFAGSDAYVSMGITAENVAKKYGITRETQDEFGALSHNKAEAAQKAGLFKEEIIPVQAVKVEKNTDGKQSTKTFAFEQDEGIRYGSSPKQLAGLRTVFKAGGTVTAGTSSQTSDGASFVILMEKERAKAEGFQVLGLFRGFSVVGLDPAYMGMGPAYAIPKVLEKTGNTLADIDLFEINEAFASQAIASMNELGLDREKVNVNGGAIALGHPLGATGAILTVKLLNEMRRRKLKKGIVSMCIGGGMGAAGLYELE